MSLTISQIVKNLVDVNDIKHDRQYSRVAKLHKYWSRKPWFVIDQYIEKYSKKNHVVLDPFCGSGIIGLQSVLANRNFIGYDLNPFAVFLRRICGFRHIDTSGHEVNQVSRLAHKLVVQSSGDAPGPMDDQRG